MPSAAGFVLAGGRSLRMGADKALVEFAGEPLIARALGILRAAGLDTAIAGARQPLGGYAPVVADSEPELGPLGGVCAALATLEAERALFLPVDMPLMAPSLLRCLIGLAERESAAVAVPQLDGFAQTFPAVVSRAALPFLRRELEAGRRGCLAAFQAAAAALGQQVALLPVEESVRREGLVHPRGTAAESWFLNVNTASDLVAAIELESGPN
ncbi:MAG: molybdenum cofactor guanylyltransferase [Terracidiphilus sp.]